MVKKGSAVRKQKSIKIHKNHIQTLHAAFLYSGMLVAMDCWFSASAFANYSASGTPTADVLCYVIDLLHGNLGMGLATIGVSAVAVGAVFGKVSWGLAFTVVTGVSVLFGAENLLFQAGVIAGDACS